MTCLGKFFYLANTRRFFTQNVEEFMVRSCSLDTKHDRFIVDYIQTEPRHFRDLFQVVQARTTTVMVE
jgi:hypothetical protein